MEFLAIALLVGSVMRASHVRDAFFRGFAFGIGHFIVGLNWIATAFTYQARMPASYGWIAVVLLSLYMALFPGFASALAWRVSHRHEIAFAFLFAAAWLASEWLRATLFTGFAWNPLGVIWLALPAVAQCAQWIGTYGLSAVVVLLAGLLWIGLRRRWRTTVGLAASLLAVVVLIDHWIAAHPPQGASTIPIRIVQPNIGQDEKYDPTETDRNEHIYAHLSGHPSSVPRLLLWPESATLRFLELERQARSDLAALLGPRDILITGGESVTPGTNRSDDVYHNSVFGLDANGKLLWRYDKSHLVPFGEYLPVRGILGHLGLSRLVPGEGDFTPGPGPRLFPLPGFTLGQKPATVDVQICYEIVFSGRVIDDTKRPSFLFNPSNDAWFGAWGPPQHLAQARLRAIEEGIPVIRATPNGISALISPTGQLIAAVPRHRAGVIDGFMPQPLPPTIFSRLGLWTSALFGVVLAAVGVTLILIGNRMRRRFE